MRAQALKGHLDGMLLAVLRHEPLHGYAVLEVLRERSRGEIDLPSGTVYPALHRLEATGLVRSEWAEIGGRKRRVYRLTDVGLAALEGHQRSWQTMATAVTQVMNTGRAAPSGQPAGPAVNYA